MTNVVNEIKRARDVVRVYDECLKYWEGAEDADTTTAWAEAPSITAEELQDLSNEARNSVREGVRNGAYDGQTTRIVLTPEEVARDEERRRRYWQSLD